ncbi:hypothetical protein CN151_09360 [Sinorhizobium meliloti]|uniref:Uncharacterized protein n=1 Tax=Rhizobium meliloti TaxID=382 RepID=A0A222LA96_RHIML|nr:hypothetical protein SMRU11_37250 [Sinorhizobium meliloti RU11/001]ASP51066.1 hypothetical protein CDO31_05440 [Sinorhizobium meliloti]PND28383.1 hypothetical protein CN933_09925 [Sinorhizobium sp. M4_45]PST27988.1 hypothetical protein C7U62_09200 [Mesorhizobium loti]ASP57033.1 hypothetical protein CDO30_01125 [Sinorhizobium meliloti]
MRASGEIHHQELRPPPEICEPVYGGGNAATADEFLRPRKLDTVATGCSGSITPWRQARLKAPAARPTILSRQHFLLVTLLCFPCHIGKGKAFAATILIDSLARV